MDRSKQKSKLFCCGENDPNYSWEDLKQLEKKRRTALSYGNNNAGYRIIFTHFAGTAFQYVIADPVFWVTIALYVGVRIAHTRKWLFLSGGEVSSVGTFVTFLLTFFINQARSDYQKSYGISMKIKGSILEMATLAKAVLPAETASEVVRHMNAAHLVSYTCLSKTNTRENFFDPFNNELQVLTVEELSALTCTDPSMRCKGSFGHIVSWGMNDIQSALQAGDISERTADRLRSVLLDFRSGISALFNDNDQPGITLFYFHLVSLMCAFYLPLFAVNEAQAASKDTDAFTVTDIIHFLVVIFQSIYVIGMRVLGVKLMCPWEDDLEDLSVMTFVRTGWEGSNNILLNALISNAGGGV